MLSLGLGLTPTERIGTMVDTWLGLDAKVIAVTGGGSGIGQAIVAGLRAAGAIAVVLDLSVETQLARIFRVCGVRG